MYNSSFISLFLICYIDFLTYFYFYSFLHYIFILSIILFLFFPSFYFYSFHHFIFILSSILFLFFTSFYFYSFIPLIKMLSFLSFLQLHKKLLIPTAPPPFVGGIIINISTTPPSQPVQLVISGPLN